MKNTFALLTGTIAFAALTLTAGFSQAECEQTALQFFGKVKNVRYNTTVVGTMCSYQIELVNQPQEPHPDRNCPLNEGEVPFFHFLDKDCVLKEGQIIGGRMVRQGDKVWMD